jgi:hypothetical protein
MDIILLRKEAVYPIQDVEASICTQQGNIIACQVVNVLRPHDDCQLRKNCNGLQVDGCLP